MPIINQAELEVKKATVLNCDLDLIPKELLGRALQSSACMGMAVVIVCGMAIDFSLTL